MMLSKIVSTTVSDSLRGSSVTRRTSSTRSALVMVASLAAESWVVASLGIVSPARYPNKMGRIQVSTSLALRTELLWRLPAQPENPSKRAGSLQQTHLAGRRGWGARQIAVFTYH